VERCHAKTIVDRSVYVKPENMKGSNYMFPGSKLWRRKNGPVERELVRISGPYSFSLYNRRR
jgi:hypothetical protein